VEFLFFVTEHFDCYWLTTHCDGDARTAFLYLVGKVPAEAIPYIEKINGINPGASLPKADKLRTLKQVELVSFPRQAAGYLLCVTVARSESKVRTFASLTRSVIKPTSWKTLKTDGIDFENPLYWLDDNLFESERRVLEEYGVLDRFIRVDLHSNPN